MIYRFVCCNGLASAVLKKILTHPHDYASIRLLYILGENIMHSLSPVLLMKTKQFLLSRIYFYVIVSSSLLNVLVDHFLLIKLALEEIVCVVFKEKKTFFSLSLNFILNHFQQLLTSIIATIDLLVAVRGTVH